MFTELWKKSARCVRWYRAEWGSLSIGARQVLEDTRRGSIAVNGVYLTVAALSRDGYCRMSWLKPCAAVIWVR